MEARDEAITCERSTGLDVAEDYLREHVEGLCANVGRRDGPKGGEPFAGETVLIVQRWRGARESSCCPCRRGKQASMLLGENVGGEVLRVQCEVARAPVTLSRIVPRMPGQPLGFRSVGHDFPGVSIDDEDLSKKVVVCWNRAWSF